jgi:hypothetical protein
LKESGDGRGKLVFQVAFALGSAADPVQDVRIAHRLPDRFLLLKRDSLLKCGRGGADPFVKLAL